jgi:ubiquitin-conjugating enzyme E2 N
MNKMTMQSKRLAKEVKNFNSIKPGNATLEINPNNEHHYYVHVPGPSGTPYEKGIFTVELYFTEDYPTSPPLARFVTKIYHPNIDCLGKICLDILKDNWTAAIQMHTLVLSLLVLLANPNLSDPLDQKVALHWRESEDEALQMAAEWTKMYAKPIIEAEDNEKKAEDSEKTK